MTKPLVSIITPCYNGEAFLKRYFESILNQTYPNLGHATASLTLDVYGHVTDQMKQNSAARMESL